MKLILACLLSFFVLASSAQNNFVSSGGNTSSSSGTVSYSFGQIVSQKLGTSIYNKIQGVQQPYEISVPLNINLIGADIELMVFPNPTFNVLTIRVSQPSGLRYSLFTIHGKLIMSNEINEFSTQMDLSSLASSSYLLRVTNKGQVVKNFKIIKQ